MKTVYGRIIFVFFLVSLVGAFPKAAFSADAEGYLIYQDEKVGLVFLQGEKPENMDLDCLVTVMTSFVSAVDNHQVSYLKMIISSDDEIVRKILASPHLRIQRGTASKDSLLVSLGPAPPYFLAVTGKALYSAGLMVDGLAFWKCAKVKK